MYQFIIFDWDGTLMDSADKIATCIQSAAKAIDLEPPSTEAAKQIIGLGLKEALSKLFPKINEDKLQQLLQQYKYQFVEQDRTPQGLFAGVEAGLDQLNTKGALLAIATGKARAGLNRVFAEIPLESYFVATRCADETRSKPHPQMLLELLDFTAIDPKKTLMVGDTTYDMEMATHAGIDALGVGYGVHSEMMLRGSGAIEVADSFATVMKWLQADRLEPAYP